MKLLSLPVVLVVVGLGLAAVVGTSACDDSSDTCCPVSDSFSCDRFDVGGARSLQPSGTCATGVPDAFPVKKTRSIDAKGCAYWEPDLSATGRCGQARPVDAGTDSSTTDAESDASDDAESDAGDAGDAADAASE